MAAAIERSLRDKLAVARAQHRTPPYLSANRPSNIGVCLSLPGGHVCSVSKVGCSGLGKHRSQQLLNRCGRLELIRNHQFRTLNNANAEQRRPVDTLVELEEVVKVGNIGNTWIGELLTEFRQDRLHGH